MNTSHRETQQHFADYLKGISEKKPEGIEDRRLEVYQSLFFNNILGLLSSNFPVLSETLGEARWQETVKAFFKHHACQTPLFPEVGKEFIRYLENQANSIPLPDFSLELAHYEWLELALDIHEESIDAYEFQAVDSVLEVVLKCSPLSKTQAYRYPVHRIGPTFQPSEPSDAINWILVYRNWQDEVGFMQINQLTARLLEILSDQSGMTGQQLIDQLMTETQYSGRAGTFIDFANQEIQALHQRSIILILS